MLSLNAIPKNSINLPLLSPPTNARIDKRKETSQKTCEKNFMHNWNMGKKTWMQKI